MWPVCDSIETTSRQDVWVLNYDGFVIFFRSSPRESLSILSVFFSVRYSFCYRIHNNKTVTFYDPTITSRVDIWWFVSMIIIWNLLPEKLTCPFSLKSYFAMMTHSRSFVQIQIQIKVQQFVGGVLNDRVFRELKLNSIELHVWIS